MAKTPDQTNDGKGHIEEGQTDEAIFRSLYSKLSAYAAVVADAGVDADDLLQDALVATLRKQPLTALDHPQAYLRRAILNAAIDRQRKAGTFRRYAPQLIEANPSGEPHYPSDLADLDHLDPRDRAILYLVHVEGRPYEEVAELTGETPGNARLRASRARKALRSALEEEAQATAQNEVNTTTKEDQR